MRIVVHAMASGKGTFRRDRDRASGHSSRAAHFNNSPAVMLCRQRASSSGAKVCDSEAPSAHAPDYATCGHPIIFTTRLRAGEPVAVVLATGLIAALPLQTNRRCGRALYPDQAARGVQMLG